MDVNILDVQPRTIVIRAEFTLEEVEMILDYLDHTTVAYDTKNDIQMKKADNYVKSIFHDLSQLASEFSGK